MLIFYLVLVIIGLGAGFILASTGVIGPLLVPALLFLGLPSGVARGTTLISELPITVFSIIGHKGQGNLDKRIILALLPGAFFVIVGAKFSTQILESHMQLTTGILEMIVGIIVIYKAVKLTSEQAPETALITRRDMAKFATAAIIAGLVKGFCGLGWGPISIGLLLIMGVNPRRAVGSSLVIRLLLDCFGGATYATMNLVDIKVAIALVLAGTVTILPAIKWATRARRKTLSTFLGCAIILFGALVIFRTLVFVP